MRRGQEKLQRHLLLQKNQIWKSLCIGTLCKIETGKLNANAIDNSFRDGTLKTTGTDFDRIMPPVSRFGGGSRTEKKQGIIRRLSGFFEKYLGVA